MKNFLEMTIGIHGISRTIPMMILMYARHMVPLQTLTAYLPHKRVAVVVVELRSAYLPRYHPPPRDV